MAVPAYEYELEASPEFEAIHEGGISGESESEQFFGALANIARRGVGWLTATGSPQRRLALWAARQALSRGLPALGRWAGGQTGADLGSRAGSWLGAQLPQRESAAEFEWESQAEINPVRKIYADAMMEHLGHLAAETQSEAEADALAGAMVPLAAKVVPRAAPIIMRASPGLVCGLAGVVRTLRRSPATRPLVRAVPAIVHSAATNMARQASRGVAVTPQAAVRILARQTARVLGNPRHAALAFRHSQRLDRQFHRAGGLPVVPRSRCCRCGSR